MRKQERILKQRTNEDNDRIDSYQFIEPALYNIKQIIDIIVLNNTHWLELSINEKSSEFTLLRKKERNLICFRLI